MPSGTRLCRPEVTGGAITPLTIRIAHTHVGAVSVGRTRLAALALLQLGARMFGAALLRGPVVERVITLASVARSRTGS